MSREEVIDHLGTIARSGTGQFLERLTGDQRKDAQLIGQFGVGFYSAFIVADEVTVLTRRADAPAEQGVSWVSDGQGEYRVAAVERPERGTTVQLKLKADADEFLRARAVEGADSQVLRPYRVPRALDGRRTARRRPSTRRRRCGRGRARRSKTTSTSSSTRP